ncbi:MAG: GUN4 domain-containing protein [Leptolyngbya sp. IPPAS B-1204]|nr:GUN4 domain-containing protein [Elainella sp. C42_A2020_010]
MGTHYEIYQQFGSAAGWRIGESWFNYEQFNFSLAAPAGHLPGVGCWSGRIALLSRPDL